jgi:hypothetical protein
VNDYRPRHSKHDQETVIFYHGTIREITGEVQPGYPPNFSSSAPGYVYFTDSADNARSWALDALAMPHNATEILEPRVYRVVPAGPYEPDPHGESAGDRRTRHSLQVLSLAWPAFNQGETARGTDRPRAEDAKEIIEDDERWTTSP